MAQQQKKYDTYGCALFLTLSPRRVGCCICCTSLSKATLNRAWRCTPLEPLKQTQSGHLDKTSAAVTRKSPVFSSARHTPKDRKRKDLEGISSPEFRSPEGTPQACGAQREIALAGLGTPKIGNLLNTTRFEKPNSIWEIWTNSLGQTSFCAELIRHTHEMEKKENNYEQMDKPPINWCRISSIHCELASSQLPNHQSCPKSKENRGPNHP